MKIAAHTLGCKNNQLETSTILDEFVLNGWEIVKFHEVADVYLINTCTVTAKSDSHSRSFIRKSNKLNPDAKIVVTGCYAQMSADEVARIEGVSLVVGNVDKNNIFNLVNDLVDDEKPEIIVKDIFKQTEFDEKDVFSASGRTRINIKVQDGCNYRCSYCIVPLARGKSRSNIPKRVVEQVKNVASKYSEVVLTGIHLGQYGLDLPGSYSFNSLLKELIQIEDLKRLRLSSIDPLELTDELIETLASTDKICRHLHISLQNGDDEILKAMKRRYNVEKYTEIINKLDAAIDGLAIGSDIIVGFPGEKDYNFENTYNTLNSLPISYLHVFTYSKRPGTVAAIMPDQVKHEVKKERNKRLKDLADVKNLAFRKFFVGKEIKIIPEFTRDKETKLLKGLTDNYFSVLLDADDSYKGELVTVKIIEASKNKTIGQLV